jgi:hypothetical protein
LGAAAQGRGVVGAGGAIHGHELSAQRGGQVHQAAVVAHHGVGAGEQIDGFG